jgi:hypothetical protein
VQHALVLSVHVQNGEAGTWAKRNAEGVSVRKLLSELCRAFKPHLLPVLNGWLLVGLTGKVMTFCSA